MYASPSDERRLSTFERALTFRFERASPAAPAEIARASVALAQRKLDKVHAGAVELFLPHARALLQRLHESAASKQAVEADELDATEASPPVVSPSASPSAPVEALVAQFLAALSNKNVITSRSLLTGEEGKTTLIVNAAFKNGSTPQSVRDWQRLFVNIKSSHHYDIIFSSSKLFMHHHPPLSR